MVKASAQRAAGLGSIPACDVGLSSRSSRTSDLKICFSMAALGMRYRVNAGTGRPGVRIL